MIKKSVRLNVWLAVAGVLLFTPLLRADPDTVDSLKQMFTDGKYKELMPKLTKALAIKGSDADEGSRYDLLMLKGETSLHLHAKQGAMDAFKQATKESKKPDEIAVATATAELVKDAAGNLKYIPKTHDKTEKPEPIDIVEPDSRKLAFAALQKDLIAKTQPKVDQAIKGSSLPDIMTVSKDLAEIKAVEIAASGSAPDTKQMAGDLGTRASGLMDEALDKMIAQLQTEVTNLKKTGRTGVPTFNKHVDDMSATSKQIIDAANAMKVTFGDSVDFTPIQSKASELTGQIQEFHDQIKRIMAKN